MNPRINEHFDDIEARLVASPVVSAFDVIRREVTSIDGKMRIRVTLTDGGLLELFEYWLEEKGQLHLRKYRFHWQDAGATLIQRRDNVKHYPDLPNAPHHTHLADGSVQPVAAPPDALAIIDEVEHRVVPRKACEDMSARSI